MQAGPSNLYSTTTNNSFHFQFGNGTYQFPVVQASSQSHAAHAMNPSYRNAGKQAPSGFPNTAHMDVDIPHKPGQRPIKRRKVKPIPHRSNKRPVVLFQPIDQDAPSLGLDGLDLANDPNLDQPNEESCLKPMHCQVQESMSFVEPAAVSFVGYDVPGDEYFLGDSTIDPTEACIDGNFQFIDSHVSS